MPPTSKTIVIYRTKSNHEPFVDWLNNIKDSRIRRRIIRRILRLEEGNYGDFKAVGDGVLELRLFFGPGYRIYFGEIGDEVVLLLLGGIKDSQSRDISKAKAYWQDFLNDLK